MGKVVVRVQVILADKTHREICIDIAEKTLGAGRETGEYFDNPDCFIALTEGGYAAWLLSLDTADLLDIAVLPECRGKGKADALMSFMHTECKARGIKEIFLEVRESNMPAILLYKKHGYEQISVRRKYYSAPTEDALIMRKTL